MFLRETTYSSSLSVVRSRTVLGQAHTPRRRLLPYAAMALAVLAAPAVGGASGSKGTAALHARQASLAGRSRAAVLDLYSLDHRLAVAHARLASFEQRAAQLHSERTSLERELAVARQSARIGQARLARQLRVLYEQGSVETIEIVLGSRSLDEAMSNIDNLDAATASNRDVLAQLKGARAHLLAARRALAGQAAALAAARAHAAATAATLTRALADRQAYLRSLARERRLTARRIAVVSTQAHAAAVRSGRLQPGAAIATGTTLTVSTTGYSLGGRTSSGLHVGWGVAAVDPSVIPLGTHMTIPGYGLAVAADTGSAIRGARIDLWFPTLARARAWGRRTVTITLR